MVDVNNMLFDPQKPNIGIIGDVGYGYPGHQPGKKSQGQQQRRIPNICAGKNLCYF